MKGYFEIVGSDLRYSGSLPHSLDEAWEITLGKWRYLCDYYKSHPGGPVIADGGTSTCGLCMWDYLDSTLGVRCDACPILHYTGGRGCLRTPYGKYHNAVCLKDLPEAQEMARAELEFLLQVRKETR